MSDEHRPARKARKTGDDRSSFDRFVEAVHLKVSRASFFFVCAGIIVVWLLSAPLWADLKSWQYVIHTTTSVITLLLLALLENAARRSEEAAQEKLNVMAEALAALMHSRAAEDPQLDDAARKLSEAVGLEERH
jgi:low affinity Fe/Cu permease